MIYHGDKLILKYQRAGNRLVYWASDLATAALYWYARRKGEYPPPHRRTTLRWVFGKELARKRKPDR